MLDSILIVATIAIVTVLLRFLPFLLFREGCRTLRIIEHLGKVLPCAIMGMLVVYCLKDTGFTSLDRWLPQLIGCAVVVLLHIRKRNTLLSIGAGTVRYMLLVQFVF